MRKLFSSWLLAVPEKFSPQLRSKGVDSAQAIDVRWPSWEQNFGGSYHGHVHRAASFVTVFYCVHCLLFALQIKGGVYGWMIFTVVSSRQVESWCLRGSVFPTWQLISSPQAAVYQFCVIHYILYTIYKKRKEIKTVAQSFEIFWQDYASGGEEKGRDFGVKRIEM